MPKAPPAPTRRMMGVPPGQTRTYTWDISERAEPGPQDPSSLVWAVPLPHDGFEGRGERAHRRHNCDPPRPVRCGRQTQVCRSRVCQPVHDLRLSLPDQSNAAMLSSQGHPESEHCTHFGSLRAGAIRWRCVHPGLSSTLPCARRPRVGRSIWRIARFHQVEPRCDSLTRL